MPDPYSNRGEHYLSAYPPGNHSDDLSHDGDSDCKASYDDLVRTDAPVDFTPGARHQTIAVNAPQLSPAGPGYPTRAGLAQQPSYASAYTTSEDAGPSKQPGWGYPPALPANSNVKESFLRRWLPDSLACRVYIITLLLETLVDLAVEGELLLRVHQEDPSDESPSSDRTMRAERNRMPVYLSIFAFAHVFQFVMALDAIYARNTLQFIFLTAFNALFLIYAVIQISEIKDVGLSDNGLSGLSVYALTRIIPVVIGIAECAFIGLGWKIYKDFGWKVYKFIGADRRMKKRYTQYQVFQCLIKFDLFFFGAFCVQFIGLVLNGHNWEFYLTCAALPLSVVLLVEGHLAARHENKWMMATFMSGCVGAMVYFVYKLYRVLSGRATDPTLEKVWPSLTIFSVLAIVLLIPTFALASLLMANFGYGLKEQLDKNERPGHRRGRSVGAAAGLSMSANPNRMSID